MTAGGEGGGLAALLTQRVATLEEENRQLRERAATAEAANRVGQAEMASLQTALASVEGGVFGGGAKDRACRHRSVSASIAWERMTSRRPD